MDSSSLFPSFIGALVGSILTAVIIPLTINITADRFIKTIINRGITNNPILSYIYWYYNTSFKTFSEIGRRSETGHPLLQPAINTKSNSLDQILISPASLTTETIDDWSKVSLETVLGANCNKPLALKNPLIIGVPSSGLQLSNKLMESLINSANNCGCALNTGDQTISYAQVQNTNQLIYTYTGQEDNFSIDALKKCCMVEIKISQGAHAPLTYGIYDNTPAVNRIKQFYEPKFFQFNDKTELEKTVTDLRRITDGVPIAVRILAGKYFEKDLALLAESKVDIVIIEAIECEAILAPEVISAHFGLPVLPALIRANKFIEKNKLTGHMDIIVSSRMLTSIDILKAIALGGKAVFISEAVILATIHDQMTKVIPWASIEELFLQGAKKSQSLNVSKAVENLTNYINATSAELAMATAMCGHKILLDLDSDKIITTNPIINKTYNIDLCY